MSDKFKYTAGLNNVGSYQVAGSPYVTASTVSQDTEQEIQFPRVTNNITVKLDSAAGGEVLNSLYLSASTGGILDYILSDSNSVGTDGDGMSLTVWLSASGQTNALNNGMIFGTGPGSSAKCSLREKNGKIQMITQNGGGASIFAQTPTMTSGWFHAAGVIANNRVQIYINGESKAHKTTAYTTVGVNMGDSFYIGASLAPFEGEYKFRDAIAWSGSLSTAQVFALYQASASYTDPAFNALPKLVWMKPTGSAGEIPPQIQTLANHGTLGGDWFLQNSSSGEIITISSESPFTGQGGSGGELRVHYRSTGSLPNVANRKHYWTLDAQDEEINMNIKTKEIYLSAVNGDCDFSLHADMTNIPAARMYQHTGSGVDE